MKLRGRNCLILGAVALTAIALDGCWVDSSQAPAPTYGPKSEAGASAAGAPGAGAAPTAGGDAGGAPAGGAPAGGAPAGGAPAGGAPAGGAPAGGAPAGGAPAGGAGGAPAGGAPAGGAGGAGTFPPAGCNAPTGTHQTTAIDRGCFVASASDCAQTAANMNPPFQALDGATNPTTRFSTGMKMSDKATAGGNFTFQFDMTTAVMIAGIKVDSNVNTDNAAQLEVEVSTNGTTWTPVACGTGATVTDFSFPAVSARYVRLTAFGSNTGWWSIWELNVYGAVGTEKPCATAGGTATGTMCTVAHTT